MSTERLYDTDAYLSVFTARVISCIKFERKIEKSDKTLSKTTFHDDNEYNEAKEYFEVVLDRTAFFPEGGGQSADIGTLGEVTVLDAHERDGIIYHLTDRPLSVGEKVTGTIDFAVRFRKMQEHTGEHILSGIADSLYGCVNVGFHLGKAEVTVDYNLPLTEEQLIFLEKRANEAVFQNLLVKAYYPDSTTLSTLSYRSKKVLPGAIRIVEIEDIDRCACCAPHVRRTGEVGIIRIMQSEKYKGGVRLWIRCGFDALDDSRADRKQLFELSHLLSAKLPECVPAVRRLFSECEALKKTASELRLSLLEKKIETARPENGMLLDFSSYGEMNTMRRYINECLPKCDLLCGCFSGTDETGYAFVLASQNDLTAITSALRTSLDARCGGSKKMISGFICATEKTIKNFFSSLMLS